MCKTKIAVILSLCGILIGCGPAIIVTNQGRTLDGVPFYTKAVACKQQTVWLEPTYILTLIGTQRPESKHADIAAGGGAGTVGTQKQEGTQPEDKQADKQQVVLFKLTKEISKYDLVSNSTFKDKFQKLIKSVIEQNPDDPGSYDAILSAFDELPGYTLPVDTDGIVKDRLILGSNRNDTYSFVDYTDPYYFNAKIRFSGTVNPEIDLGPDLTLSKASVNVQEETFQNVTGVLSAALTAAGTMVAGGGPPPPPPPRGIRIIIPAIMQLTIESQAYQYTFSTLQVDTTTHKPAKPPCKHMDPLSKFTDATTFSRTVMTVDESKKKGDEANTLKFSGSLVLPKGQPQAQSTEQTTKGK